MSTNKLNQAVIQDHFQILLLDVFKFQNTNSFSSLESILRQQPRLVISVTHLWDQALLLQKKKNLYTDKAHINYVKTQFQYLFPNTYLDSSHLEQQLLGLFLVVLQGISSACLRQ